jgi:hypothetical protein
MERQHEEGVLVSLMKLIEGYDRAQLKYIQELETQVEELEEKNSELTTRLTSYIATVDRMKLELILAGALRKPEGGDDGRIGVGVQVQAR